MTKQIILSQIKVLDQEKPAIYEENWKKIIGHGELVLVEESGFRYFNERIYEIEIDNSDFPNFKMKEIL